MTIPSLITASPHAGQELARQLAGSLLASLPDDTATMQAMLNTRGGGHPAPAVIIAIYFHAIALANGGWATSSSPS